MKKKHSPRKTQKARKKFINWFQPLPTSGYLKNFVTKLFVFFVLFVDQVFLH